MRHTSKTLLVGHIIPGAPGRPRVARPFVGRRVAELVFEPQPDGSTLVGLAPTAPARRWADDHRRLDCRCYVACLEAAAVAQAYAVGPLASHLTWECDGCPVVDED